ncbi:phage BR0599 family protein [Acinetobacter bereziniae]|uniref:phage BR0599 family protein n=1 Tax=Acinetobacter bereziniae TaxID=106648 RepID=UPI001901C5F5|nr:phage BR0599 family protein [Acinetobacter bereziniae]MBJ9904801.1 phage BR0599 family protein [Acinetobacter bereziniae]MCU4317884.1 DUF2163 domain-containing protein [Acinetobacter bereziniae]MCU4600165.1 DUF2163 domain-containing protein [Acinetobacter bereziniae]
MIFKSRKELYQFKHGAKAWYFTSSSKPVVHNEITYQPIRGMSRTDIEDAGIDKADVDITFPQIPLLDANGEDLQQLFINKIFYDAVTVTILEIYKGDSLVLFKGRVTVPKFDEDAKTMTLVASTNETYQHRQILTRKFQKPCPNKIYDRFCGLDFDTWSSKAKVLSFNDLQVIVQFEPTVTVVESVDENENPVVTTTTIQSSLTTIDAKDTVTKTKTIVKVTTDKDTGEETTVTTTETIFTREAQNAFARGLIYKNGVYVFVVNSSGMRLSMYRPFPYLKVGDEVFIAMGCDQSMVSCKTFGNNMRFMGHPYMPNTNPVNDEIVK